MDEYKQWWIAAGTAGAEYMVLAYVDESYLLHLGNHGAYETIYTGSLDACMAQYNEATK